MVVLSRVIVLLWLVILIPRTSAAIPIVVDFENLFDGDPVTNQYPGLIFTNTTAITAGISLNEFEFPPASGENVVFDDGAPISIDFLTPVLSFGGYFTYLAPLTLTAFDIGNNVLGTVNSTYSNNLALSGDPGSSPNELLFFSSLIGISSVTIAGHPTGESFTADDVTINASAVPEPGQLSLLFIGLLGVLGLRRWRGSGSRLPVDSTLAQCRAVAILER